MTAVSTGFFKAPMAPPPIPPHVPVNLGDMVLWYPPSGNQSPAAAIVHRINSDGSVALSVIPEPRGEDRNGLDQSRVCCLHHDEPVVGRERFLRYGTWDLTATEKSRRAELAELREAIKSLSKKAPK